MLNNTIYISKMIDSQSLITRQAARNLFTQISSMQESVVYVDFAGINFASRSFFDELNSSQNKLKLLGKQLEFQNLNDSLSSLLEIVKTTSHMRSSVNYTSTANAEVMSF